MCVYGHINWCSLTTRTIVLFRAAKSLFYRLRKTAHFLFVFCFLIFFSVQHFRRSIARRSKYRGQKKKRKEILSNFLFFSCFPRTPFRILRSACGVCWNNNTYIYFVGLIFIRFYCYRNVPLFSFFHLHDFCLPVVARDFVFFVFFFASFTAKFPGFWNCTTFIESSKNRSRNLFRMRDFLHGDFDCWRRALRLMEEAAVICLILL